MGVTVGNERPGRKTYTAPPRPKPAPRKVAPRSRPTKPKPKPAPKPRKSAPRSPKRPTASVAVSPPSGGTYPTYTGGYGSDVFGGTYSGGTAGIGGTYGGTTVTGGGGGFPTYTDDEIAAAMKAIETRYGLSAAELESRADQIGLTYRLLQSQMQAEHTTGVETTREDFRGRGVYRSGFHASSQAELAAKYSALQAENEQKREAEAAAIAAQIAALEDEREAEKAAEKARIGRANRSAKASAGQA